MIDGLGVRSVHRLAQLIGEDQPVHTFQHISQGPNDLAAVCLEELASTFVDDLIAHDPHGPYFLAGYSHGALVAFEMACQLAERGRPIGILALIDMWGVGFPIKISPSRWELWRRRKLAGLSSWFTARSDLSPQEPNAATTPVPDAQTSPEHVRFDAMIDTYRWLLWMRHFPGRMTLFRASEAINKPGYRFDDPCNGCASLADAIEIHGIPGDHVSLIREPHVQVLAAELRRQIRMHANATEQASNREGVTSN